MTTPRFHRLAFAYAERAYMSSGYARLCRLGFDATGTVYEIHQKESTTP